MQKESEMLTKVTEDIHKLVVHFPDGMGEVNSYLLKGEQGYTVVDTGTYAEESLEQWKQVVDSGIVIEKVVLTHTHQDHIGFAKWFQQQIGVPVFVSDLGYKEMQKHREVDTKAQINNMVQTHGGPGLPGNIADDSFIYEFEPDGIFQNHEQIRLGDDYYEAIWTPGHAPDHFCFYQKEKKVMIMGDHVLKDVSPVIGLWSGEEENPLRDYYNSLRVVSHYPADVTLPGHGETIYQLNDRVNEIKARHDQRLQQVLGLVKSERKTANQVCQEIYGTVNIILQLSYFMATLTRLLYLEAEGKVEREEINGEVKFLAI